MSVDKHLGEFLLVKRGLFYRPDRQGYTGIKANAGRYFEHEADELSSIKAIHEDEAPMFSPACFHDVKVDYLLKLIAERDATIAELRAKVSA